MASTVTVSSASSRRLGLQNSRRPDVDRWAALIDLYRKLETTVRSLGDAEVVTG